MWKKEIKNYKHSFVIDGNEIELVINCREGLWTCEITKGKTGTGICSGGEYNSLQEYIKDMEKQHRYSFNFFQTMKTLDRFETIENERKMRNCMNVHISHWNPIVRWIAGIKYEKHRKLYFINRGEEYC